MNNRQYFGSLNLTKKSRSVQKLDAELQGLSPRDIEDYEEVQQITRIGLGPSHDKGFVRYGQGGTADE